MKDFIKYLIICSSVFILVPYSSAAEVPSVEDIQALESMKLGKDVIEEKAYIEVQTSTTKEEEDCEVVYLDMISLIQPLLLSLFHRTYLFLPIILWALEIRF